MSTKHINTVWAEGTLFCKIPKLASSCLSVCLSVCPHGPTRLPLVGFSKNSICKCFSTICRENSSFIKIWQEERVLYMKTYVHLWQYLAEFFLEWKMLQRKVVERIKTHILFSIPPPPQSHAFYGVMWKKYRTAREATDYNLIRRMRFAFPQQQWLREHTYMLRYTKIACLVRCETIWCLK
jgi:hypothetical protein